MIDEPHSMCCVLATWWEIGKGGWLVGLDFSISLSLFLPFSYLCVCECRRESKCAVVDNFAGKYMAGCKYVSMYVSVYVSVYVSTRVGVVGKSGATLPSSPTFHVPDQIQSTV